MSQLLDWRADRLMLGSQTAEVLAHSNIPVLAVK